MNLKRLKGNQTNQNLLGTRNGVNYLNTSSIITIIILITISEIVECAGGQYIPKMPLNNDENTFVVSCEADKKVLTKAIKAGIKIQNKEVILTGLLRQKVEFDKHGLVV